MMRTLPIRRRSAPAWNRLEFGGPSLWCLLACVLLSAGRLPAQGEDVLRVPGPTVYGNGLSNGVGATLARLFVRVRGLDADLPGSVPLELRLGSALVTAEPLVCDPATDESCPDGARGVAGVSGYPSSPTVSVWRLKLGGAQYLPPVLAGTALPPDLRGASIETAFEGALTIQEPKAPGSAVRMRLLLADRQRLAVWGANNLFPPSSREFSNNTGTAMLLRDRRGLLFPGTIEGTLVADTGNSLVIQLRSLDVASPEDNVRNGLVPALSADHAAANAAGLPASAFGLIEINYTGLPSPSRVFASASSNDVEIHHTVEEQPIVFQRGDCDGDGFVGGSVTDAVYLLVFSFGHGPTPPCLEACDADGDGVTVGQVTDAVYLMSFGFLGGPAPPAPFPDCGQAEEILLDCEAYPGCR